MEENSETGWILYSYVTSIGYIPAQRDIIPREKGQHLREAEEEPRAKPEPLLRHHKNTDLS